MKDEKLEFDPYAIRFRKAGSRVGLVLKWLLSLLAISIVLFVLVYAVFATFFSTDGERRMSREIRVYKELYSRSQPDEQLLADVLAGIQVKDNAIYEKVFNAHAPGIDPMANLASFYASDTIPETRIYSYTRDKADKLVKTASRVDEAFRSIVASLSSEEHVMPPMNLPLNDIGYTQVGASTGSKINPFYKAYVQHRGIDLIAARGTPVYASADGEVTVSRFNYSNVGNQVVIRHAGGYETVYCHLQDRLVRPGQVVRRGQRIGSVGMSGHAYAPHLHYEILKDGENLDPIDYFFASVTPEEYANMLYMTINTQQSLD